MILLEQIDDEDIEFYNKACEMLARKISEELTAR